MNRPAWIYRVAFGVSLFLAGAALAGVVNAQGADTGDVLPTDEGTRKLQDLFKSKAINEALNSLVAGTTQASAKDAKDMKVIDTAAQWYAYRLTWDDYLGETKATAFRSIPMVHRELDSMLRSIATSRGDNKDFAALFTRQVAKRVKEVMQKGKLRARVNGAVMLQRLAQTGQPGLVADMVEVLESPKFPDYLKLYGIKGLKELLARQPPPTDAAARKAYIARYSKAVSLLISYVEKKPDVPKDAPPAEKARLDDVHRYFRREAIQALAQVRLPALEVDAKAKKIEAPVAYWLLKVVANDGLAPRVSLSEQVEAAYGLLLLRSDGTPYQTELTLHVVGKFLATDMASRFNADLQRAGTTEVKRRPKKKDKTARSQELTPVREEPWALYAARLAYAMEELELSSTNPAAKKKVTDVYNKAKLVLSQMRLSFTGKTKAKSVDDGDRNQLAEVADKVKPGQMCAFKGFEAFEIKVGTDE